MDELRSNCPMRHEKGTCLPMCGPCKAVSHVNCAALQNAYRKGKRDTILAIMDAVEKQKEKDNA